MAREQDDRFAKLVRQLLIASLVFAVVVPLLPVPQPAPNQVQEPPPRFARLLLEKPAPPPPPPPVVVEQKEVVVPDEPAVVVEKPVNTPKPAVVTAAPKEKARETAARAGLLPFAEQLAALRDSAVVDNVMGDANLAASAGEAQHVERSVISAKAGSGSGGISTAGMSRNTGGGGLASRSTTQVASPVGAAGSGKPDVVRGGSAPSRSREEIELVFDQNKGSIFALYNRALRRDSSLQGKIVLELTIDPSGAVTSCRIVSSDLNDDELEHKLVQRVKMFRFQDKDVATVTTTKPIDFFPA